MPVAVTTLPDSFRIESATVFEPVNLTILPEVPVPVIPPPAPTQFPSVYKQTVSVLPPGMTGTWIVASPVPLGFKAWKITCLLLLLLVARLMLPTVVPGVPTVKVLPWTVSVPVKFAAEEIVCPLILPEVIVPVPALILALLVTIPPLAFSWPPRVVAPVPTVKVLLPVTEVFPLSETAPVPVPKVPDPLWAKLPLLWE